MPRHGRRLLAIALVVLGAIPALLGLSLVWVMINTWREQRRLHDVLGGSQVHDTYVVSTSVSFPGVQEVAVEPWHLLLGTGVLAAMCFGAGWVLLRGADHDHE